MYVAKGSAMGPVLLLNKDDLTQPSRLQQSHSNILKTKIQQNSDVT